MLYIERVGEAPLTVTLCLHNTSSTDDVLFRIQTTSPTIYRVRPSHGRISAMSSTETQVVMVGEPVKADKFLVKYTTVATETATGDFLPMFEQAAAKMAMERRLRVVLLGSDGAEVGGSGTGAGTGTGNAKEDNATLRRDSTSPPSKRADPVKRSDSFASQHSITSTPPAVIHESMESPPTVAGTVMSESALQAELKEARSKIQLLVAKNQELSKALDDAKVTLSPCHLLTPFCLTG